MLNQKQLLTQHKKEDNNLKNILNVDKQKYIYTTESLLKGQLKLLDMLQKFLHKITISSDIYRKKGDGSEYMRVIKQRLKAKNQTNIYFHP